MSRLIAAAFVVSLMVGCSSDECADNKNSLPLAKVMTSQPEPKEAALNSITVYGIGAPGDSLLVDSASNVGQVYLPFRIDTGNTTYVIRYWDQPVVGSYINDTISFSYDIKPMFVSSACGAVYYYDNIRIDHTYNLIDSINCPGDRITNANEPNIFIYFRMNEE